MKHKQDILDYLLLFGKLQGYQLLASCEPGEMGAIVRAIRDLEKDGSVTVVNNEKSQYVVLSKDVKETVKNGSEEALGRSLKVLLAKGVSLRQARFKLKISQSKARNLLDKKTTDKRVKGFEEESSLIVLEFLRKHPGLFPASKISETLELRTSDVIDACEELLEMGMIKEIHQEGINFYKVV